MAPNRLTPSGRLDRRSFLGGCVGASVGLAGCLGSRGPTGMTVAGVAVGESPGEPIRVLPPDTVTLLDFWATWCAPCRPQMAELRAVAAHYPAVHQLSITNESDRSAIKAFWREYDGTWPVAMDPDLATNDRFGVTRIPTLLVFDVAGERTWKHVGLTTAETIGEHLEAARA